MGKISMPSAGFESAIPAIEGPQNYALDSADTGIGNAASHQHHYYYHRLYSPGWNLACSRKCRQRPLSCASARQFLQPSFLESSSTPSIHLDFGRPRPRWSSGFVHNIFQVIRCHPFVLHGPPTSVYWILLRSLCLVHCEVPNLRYNITYLRGMLFEMTFCIPIHKQTRFGTACTTRKIVAEDRTTFIIPPECISRQLLQ